MKKRVLTVIFAVLAAFSLSGCEKGGEIKDNTDGIEIVCTFYPQYSWVKNLTKDTGADVILLQKGGTDFHSYQPTFEDTLKVQTCDVLVCIGGESDSWSEEAAQNGGKAKVVSVMEEVSEKLIDESVRNGKEQENTEKEKDEHVYLSVKNAKTACKAIAETLCEADGKNAERYRENLQEYLGKLEEIDKEFEKLTENCARKNFVMPDRYPFAYLSRDYGLECFAAFKGCSSETDASFETVVFLSEKIKELDVKYVAVTENSDKKTAKSVIENSGKDGIEILELNSMQSLSENDVKSAEYTDIMLENLEAFRLLLN
ncbi:MAG: zinc ABC transporter substrate-binding protein [Clostridia bacterium]|nr:zinc ABC transporter substrate-binding protein [Clostridia bacterium]MBR4979077.1 zinc ABC transporter substrate-binding protein [Clostridia bacterium]